MYAVPTSHDARTGIRNRERLMQAFLQRLSPRKSCAWLQVNHGQVTTWRDKAGTGTSSRSLHNIHYITRTPDNTKSASWHTFLRSFQEIFGLQGEDPCPERCLQETRAMPTLISIQYQMTTTHPTPPLPPSLQPHYQSCAKARLQP